MEIRGLPALAGIARYGPLPVSEALRRCDELLGRAEGDRRAETLIQRAIAHLHAMEGDFSTAREITGQVRRTLEELGANFDAALVSLDSGPIEMMAGEPDAAVRELQRDYETLDGMGERNYITTNAAYLAEALYRSGRADAASAYASFSETVAAADDLLTQLLWRGVRGKLLARSARFDDGVEVAREAVRLAHTSDDPTAQGNALADLAEVFMLGGRGSEASTALDAAMARFESKGNLSAASEARRRLDQVAAEREGFSLGGSAASGRRR
jgi:tetratricopeptide (TPR) repeat protein